MKLLIMLGCLLGLSARVDAAEDLITLSRELADEAMAVGRSVVEGDDGWLFFVPELRHIAAGPFWGEAAETASRARRADARDPLPAILDVHQALQDIGVELILVPVPPKAVVYPQFLPGADTLGAERLDPHHREFYRLLAEHGVKVLDLTDIFRAGDHPDYGAFYCQEDTHWSGWGCVVAAEKLAEMLGDRVSNPAPESFATEWRTIEIRGDLHHMMGATEGPAEALWVREVDGETRSADSPVLVLGDSHSLVFHAGGDMHHSGAGLVDQLAAELQQPIDLIGVRGSGATPARINLFRRAQRESDFWEKKEVVIWVFSAREFTESDGWRIVPVAP